MWLRQECPESLQQPLSFFRPVLNSSGMGLRPADQTDEIQEIR